VVDTVEVFVVEETTLQQTMPATKAAVTFARGLAHVDRVEPVELREPLRVLLEANLEATVGAKRELPDGVLRALSVAQALEKAPEPGTGAYA
jgi:hypothetical protein